MALTCDVALKNGLTVPDAYVRIDSVFGSKNAMNATANVYLSEAAFRGSGPHEGPQPLVEQLIIAFTPDLGKEAPNLFAQAYVALRETEGFADARDC